MAKMRNTRKKDVESIQKEKTENFKGRAGSSSLINSNKVMSVENGISLEGLQQYLVNRIIYLLYQIL